MRAYERLIRYAQYPTASDAENPNCPSTPAQRVFAQALVEEMQAMGIADARVDEHGYVYGTIPANIPDWKGTTIGFIAHMDVVRDVPFENVKARVVENYQGGEIILNEEQGITLSPEEFPHLLNYVGHDLVVTDGTTLLGADNKAGIAEILTMAEILLSNPEIKHGEIKIAFTPDEEIGRGADRFDVEGFGAQFAYTVDGGAFGEVEFETFNAASAKVRIRGKNIHPGTAKGKMKNANLIAMEFAALLPTEERPEKTEGYEGFYHLTDMGGTVEEAYLAYILRDHDWEKLQLKKDTVLKAAEEINGRYGRGTVEVQITDSYRNMAEQIRPHWHLLKTTRVRKSGGV